MRHDLGQAMLGIAIWALLIGGTLTNSLPTVLAGVGFAIVYHADKERE